YFKDNSWNLWDFENKEATDMGELAGINFENTDWDYTGIAPPIEPVIWIGNDEFLLLHDTYDIHKIDLKKKSLKTLTNGRKDNRKFRIERNHFQKENMGLKFFKGYFNFCLENSVPVVLKVKNDSFQNGL